MFVMSDIGPTEFGDYVFPDWADFLGWMIGTSTLLPFVIFVIYRWWTGEVNKINILFFFFSGRFSFTFEMTLSFL